MTILHNEKAWCASGVMNTLINNVNCLKTHDSRVHAFVVSTKRKRQGVSEADTTNVDRSAIGVHNKNSDDSWSICTYSLTRGLCYALHVQRYILLANICNVYARQSLQHILSLILY